MNFLCYYHAIEKPYTCLLPSSFRHIRIILRAHTFQLCKLFVEWICIFVKYSLGMGNQLIFYYFFAVQRIVFKQKRFKMHFLLGKEGLCSIIINIILLCVVYTYYHYIHSYYLYANLVNEYFTFTHQTRCDVLLCVCVSLQTEKGANCIHLSIHDWMREFKLMNTIIMYIWCIHIKFNDVAAVTTIRLCAHNFNYISILLFVFGFISNNGEYIPFTIQLRSNQLMRRRMLRLPFAVMLCAFFRLYKIAHIANVDCCHESSLVFVDGSILFS